MKPNQSFLRTVFAISLFFSTLFSVAAENRDQQRHRGHEHDTEDNGGEACAACPDRIAAASRMADTHRRGDADAERHHEDNSGDLERDLVTGDGGCRDPAHHHGGNSEQAVFKKERAGNRQADEYGI